MLSESRTGNFTSSQIYRLMKDGKGANGWGAPCWTYIDECNMERRLGRRLTKEVSAQATTWGQCCEMIAFQHLTINYRLCSNETLTHSDIPFWKGTPDATKTDTVGDLKCPHTLKSFCELLDPHIDNKRNEIHPAKNISAVRMNSDYGDKYFWQLVSNAILTGSKYAELIVFCPYLDELETIRAHAQKLVDKGDTEYRWITYATDEKLAYIIRDTHYKNINHIFFEVLDRDKEALTRRIKEAGEYLIKVES